ncbi:MAG: sensor histidine kinase, partial [Solirubrobacteraceae bacterium]
MYSANAGVLVAAVVFLALSPVTISWPINRDEAVVLVAALLAMLAINLGLMRRALAPLKRLSRALETVEPLKQGQRIDVGARSQEVVGLTEAFNAVLDRLEHERRDSARRAQAAQEHERRQLSLELHDEVGQSMTALLLQLDVAARTAGPDRRAGLETATETVRDTLDRIRGIVRRLRPVALDDLGLASALAHLCDRVSAATRLEINRAIARDLPALHADTQLVVYRVVQESLTNIARHAGARSAVVRLERHADGVRAQVIDDGAGLPADWAPGSGIRGMQERALTVGSGLTISAVEPHG